MKNVILSTLFVAITLCASSQSYQMRETNRGKNYLIKNSNGVTQAVRSKSRTENIKHEMIFPASFVQVQTADAFSGKNPERNVLTHHLTLHFNKNMDFDGNVHIVSSSCYYDDYDLTWTEGGTKAEIDLPEDHYEIISSYDDFFNTANYYYVFMHALNINQDVDTTVNFEEMATHSLVMRCMDENNQQIEKDDPSVMQKGVTFDIEFPEGFVFRSSLLQGDIANGYKFSDVNEGFKIITNQFFVRPGGLYITDFPQLNGLDHDTTLINDPSDYKRMQMRMHASPAASPENYITFGYGSVYNLYGFYMCSLNFGMYQNYPYQNNDTVMVFANNHENPSNAMTATVANSLLWEEDPLAFNFKFMKSDAFFISPNDSIVFTSFNTSAATPKYPDKCMVDLGNTAPCNFVTFRNNQYADNSIFCFSNSYGGNNEIREIDGHQSIYEIRKGEEILVQDTLKNFMDPFTISGQGVYTFSISNNNYTISGQSGQSNFEATFNTGNEDANPPVLSSFKLLSADKSITNHFFNTSSGSILLSSFDLDTETLKVTKPSSVEVYYKNFNDSAWISLGSVENTALFDSSYYGSFYACDLSPVLSQFSASGYLDIKIVIVDAAGNAAMQSLHPAAFVENNVGVPQPAERKKCHLQVYPNPTAGSSIVSFTLAKDTRSVLSVYSMNGRLTEIIQDGMMEKGSHQLNWNASAKLSPGIYLLKLETEAAVETTKVTIR